MTKSPLVSIIIPTFNRAHLIGETLDSVLAQTYQNWECIVVDDGSMDDTAELMESYCKRDARFQYHHRPDDRLPGGNAARNYGFEVSKGEYVNWLDSDDLILEDKLKIQLNFLIKNRAKVCVSNGKFFSNELEENNDKLWTKYLIIGELKEDLILQKVRWPIGSIIWKRDVVKNTKWNEGLKGAQEWLFHILMAIKLNQNYFCFCNQALLLIRCSNDSITRNALKSKRFNSYLYARLVLLKELKNNNIELFSRYYEPIYSISVKYIKGLVIENNYSIIKVFAKFIIKNSKKQGFTFLLGLAVFKLLKKDYFLKRVI